MFKKKVKTSRREYFEAQELVLLVFLSLRPHQDSDLDQELKIKENKKKDKD
jgi:hypothetical protein